MGMRNNGFSLAELLTGLVIVAIVVLTISAIGSTAAKSYKDFRDQTVYNSDKQFVTDTLRAALRRAATDPLKNGNLELDVGSKRLYFTAAGSLYYLIYGDIGSSANDVRVLTGVTLNPAIAFNIDNSLSPLVKVTLNYTKAGVAYSCPVSATRRN